MAAVAAIVFVFVLVAVAVAVAVAVVFLLMRFVTLYVLPLRVFQCVFSFHI